MPFQFLGSQKGYVSTGNVRTTYDPISTVVAANAGWNLGSPASYQLQSGGIGLRVPLGTVILDQGGSDSVSGTTTQLPVGQVALYKYVLYKSTTNPALVAFPGLVYYTDNTNTIVSGAPADAYISANPPASLAGVMMLNTGDLSTATATLLNNAGNGSGVWMCIGGFVKSCASIASTAAGDTLIGQLSGTNFTPNRVAVGTAPTFVKNMTALTAIASSVSDVIVNIVPVS